MEIIPVSGFDNTFQLHAVPHRTDELWLLAFPHARKSAPQRHKAAPPLFVDLARIRLGAVHIGLIALHRPSDIRKFDTAVLDAAVEPCQPILELQLEIRGIPTHRAISRRCSASVASPALP